MARRLLCAAAMALAFAVAACGPPLPPSCNGDGRVPVNWLAGGC